MSDLEMQVRAALAKLGAANGASMAPAPVEQDDEHDDEPAPVIRRHVASAPRAPRARPATVERIGAGPMEGAYAEVRIGADTVTVRIGAVSGMKQRATVQRCDTRQVLTVGLDALDNVRDCE